MTAADRLDAIEGAIPPEAANDPLYADFFRARDVAALVAALRGVLELHHPRGHGRVVYCAVDMDGPYPCPTVAAITAALTEVTA